MAEFRTSTVKTLAGMFILPFTLAVLPIVDLNQEFGARVHLPNGKDQDVLVRAMDKDNAVTIIKMTYCGGPKINCIIGGPWLSRNHK